MDDDPISTIVIRPTRGWAPIDLKELWRYRELLFFFIWRDVKVRYRQTLLGATWVIARPLVLIGVFTIVFGRIANVTTLGIPYPLFAAAALIPWSLFHQGLLASSDSLVLSASLIGKIYYPRLISPIAAACTYLVDLGVGFLLLIGLMAYYGVAPSLRVLWIVPLSLLTLASALALGVWLSALNVRYRDIRFAVPFLIQTMMFVSPIGYSSVEISGAARLVYAINPMAGIADGFRWALLGADTRPGSLILISTATTILVGAAGLFYFRRAERTFADVI